MCAYWYAVGTVSAFYLAQSLALVLFLPARLLDVNCATPARRFPFLILSWPGYASQIQRNTLLLLLSGRKSLYDMSKRAVETYN